MTLRSDVSELNLVSDPESSSFWSSLTVDQLPEGESSSQSLAQSLSVVEQSKVKARNGKSLPTLQEFISLLSKLGIDGPSHFRLINLRDSAVRIGRGSQFTVFKGETLGTSGKVYKRVNLTSSFHENGSFEATNSYRKALRHLELEALSLSDFRLRNHRNIVKLLAWALDYDDHVNGIPVLVMEAALFPLSTLLSTQVHRLCSHGDVSHWTIRYRIILDVVAGLEAIHECDIIHGDIKPDNILLFPQNNPDIPFVAKLGDFGLALDMQDSELSPCSYRGTQSWVGNEVGMKSSLYEKKYGLFESWHLKLFDSFSFGMVVMAVFVTEAGRALNFNDLRKSHHGLTDGEIAASLIRGLERMPHVLANLLVGVVEKLLQETPSNRPLPTIELLKSTLNTYHVFCSLVIMHQQQAPEILIGRKDPNLNRGPSYWRTLDGQLLITLDNQYQKQKGSKGGPSFSGSTLLGLAQAFASRYMEKNRSKVLHYVLSASREGYVPAQAICERIFEANDEEIPVERDVLKMWSRNALATGYIFHKDDDIGESERKSLWNQFRNKGGYSIDGFTRARELVELVRDATSLANGIDELKKLPVIDNDGNTFLHLCASLGEVESLKLLLQHPHLSKPVLNDHGEGPIYKACQAGHLEALSALVAAGHRVHGRSGSISEAHWLFTFDDGHVEAALELLITAGVDINHSFCSAQEGGRPVKAGSLHFPFIWPFGTPLNWAVCAQNSAVIQVLVKRGALLNFSEGTIESIQNPLTQAVCDGDDTIVKLLVDLGADCKVKSDGGRNLLHQMSFHSGKPSGSRSGSLRSWLRHGKMENSLRARCNIAQILVASGVALEERSTAYDGLSPLLQASVDSVFRDEVVASALLTVGATPTAASTKSNQRPLCGWASEDLRSLTYPRAYFPLMKDLVKRMPDLNFVGDHYDGTVIHAAVRSGGDVHQLHATLNLVKRRTDYPHGADINLLDGYGSTALMSVLTTSSDEAELRAKVQVLFDACALPTVTNGEGENVLTALMRNNRLIDKESNDSINFMIGAGYFRSKASLSRFIDGTNSTPLAIACNEGKFNTLQTLLNLGMASRVNELMSSRDVLDRTALDQAFFGADESRREYLTQMSYFTNSKLQRTNAESRGFIYTNNMFGANPDGQPSPARMKERYWDFPKVLRLLLAHGAERLPIDRSAWETEPSFQDAYSLPRLGLSEADRPHQAHWQPLFELEQLGQGWEQDCLLKIKEWYSDEEFITPPVKLFERWPQVIDVLAPSGHEEDASNNCTTVWYRAVWTGDVNLDLVEVGMNQGKIKRVRNYYDKRIIKTF